MQIESKEEIVNVCFTVAQGQMANASKGNRIIKHNEVFHVSASGSEWIEALAELYTTYGMLEKVPPPLQDKLKNFFGELTILFGATPPIIFETASVEWFDGGMVAKVPALSFLEAVPEAFPRCKIPLPQGEGTEKFVDWLGRFQSARSFMTGNATDRTLRGPIFIPEVDTIGGRVP